MADSVAGEAWRASWRWPRDLRGRREGPGGRTNDSKGGWPDMRQRDQDAVALWTLGEGASEGKLGNGVRCPRRWRRNVHTRAFPTVEGSCRRQREARVGMDVLGLSPSLPLLMVSAEAAPGRTPSWPLLPGVVREEVCWGVRTLAPTTVWSVEVRVEQLHRIPPTPSPGGPWRPSQSQKPTPPKPW